MQIVDLAWNLNQSNGIQYNVNQQPVQNQPPNGLVVLSNAQMVALVQIPQGLPFNPQDVVNSAISQGNQ